MYSSFRVRNYRGFEDLKLNDLARVNLIAGDNNSGKTALLEALYLHAMRGEPAAFGFIAQQRLAGATHDPSSGPFWVSMFRNMDASNTVWLEGEGDLPGWSGEGEGPWCLSLWPMETSKDSAAYKDQWGGNVVAAAGKLYAVRSMGSSFESRSQVEGQPPSAGQGRPREGWTAHYVPAQGTDRETLVRVLTDMVREGEEDALTEALKLIDPRLRAIKPLPHPGGSGVLHADLGLKRLLPFGEVGEGMNHLLSILVALGQAPGGIVLIDEVETGLHHTKLEQVWRAVADAAQRLDVQVFATTHSYECIEAAQSAFAATAPEDLKLYRLQEFRKQMHAVSYETDMLGAAVEMGMEVR